MDKTQRHIYKHVSGSASTDTIDKLDENFIGENEESCPHRQRRRCNMHVAALLASIAASGVIGFIFGTSVPLTTKTPAATASDTLAQIMDCGKSPAEAKAAGCKFDLMLQRWIPADCYDEEHSELFLAKYPRKWYYDIDLEHEMDDATVSDAERRSSRR
ncbi:hypothetical protein SLS62_005201 [Diatrype stigma]|uniref:Uncharacterized protein n=1 Tax=Diatrype stigma TaxID=117547 RepID=A0AAN9UPJ3_9PEZI